MKGYLSLLGGIVLFSTVEVASKLMQSGGAVAGHDPFWLAFFRSIITGTVLFYPAVHRLRLRGVSFGRRDVLALSGLGLLGVTLMSGLYHLSITFLPANAAALVFSCNPVFVVLFAPLILPEKITVRKLIAVLLCLCGILALARGRTDGISSIGLLIMLGSTILFALYTVLFKKMTPHYGALPITAFAALAGGVLLLPCALDLEGFPPVTYRAVDWAGIAYLSLIGTALGYFLFIYGMGHVEAGIGSMAFFLKPFLAALFAWVLLGEDLTLPLLLGGVLILSGMAVALSRIPAKHSSSSKRSNA